MKNKKRSFKPAWFLVYIVMIVYAVICLYPVIWMGFYSLKNNEEIFVTNPFGPPIVPQWSNYVKAVTQFDIPLYFRNSIVVSLAAMFFGILFCLTFTYVVARVRVRTTKDVYTNSGCYDTPGGDGEESSSDQYIMVADHPVYGSEFSLRGHGALRILPHPSHGTGRVRLYGRGRIYEDLFQYYSASDEVGNIGSCHLPVYVSLE